MAFKAKILSWRFRHLNIVGCLLKWRPTKGGGGGVTGTPGPPKLRPWIAVETLDKSCGFSRHTFSTRTSIIYLVFLLSLRDVPSTCHWKRGNVRGKRNLPQVWLDILERPSKAQGLGDQSGQNIV